jgi:hypothetical protein
MSRLKPTYNENDWGSGVFSLMIGNFSYTAEQRNSHW